MHIAHDCAHLTHDSVGEVRFGLMTKLFDHPVAWLRKNLTGQLGELVATIEK
jgi:hypothetical protein